MRGINPVCFCLAAIGLFTLHGAAQNAQRDQGIKAFEEGRYSIALSALRSAVKQNPHDETAAVFLALTQAAMGNCKAALAELSKPRRDAVLDRLSGIAEAKCESASGNEAAAFSRLQQLKTRFPNDADILYLDATLHMKAFNDATFAMFQHTPSSYRVHELSAQIFEVQNRYSEAIAEYKKAIELNPNAPGLHYRLGRAMLLASHSPQALQEAAEEFQAELRISPEDSACEFQLGQIAQTQSNMAQAQAHFERAIQLSPDFTQALIALGKIYSQEKQYSQAIELLSRATRIQPSNEAAHYALMTAYRDAGQMEKATAEKMVLDHLQKPPEGEFSDFLKKLGEKQPAQ